MPSDEVKEEAREKAKLRVLQETEDIRFVMSSAEGRRFMCKLLCRARIYQCSFTGQSNQTIFNEGGRNQGLMLQADIMTHAPGSYQLMMKENENG
jgi:hypothetical protein